jgi:hypothetical protein
MLWRLLRLSNLYKQNPHSVNLTMVHSKYNECGEVLEWTNRSVWKALVAARLPWVRIPPSPPRFRLDAGLLAY